MSLRDSAATWGPRVQREEETARHQLRSPREVQVLLSSIESREAALRTKVQQLAEEKASQQQRLEEEVRALQRSNAQMEAELRMRQRADGEPRGQTAGSRELAYG